VIATLHTPRLRLQPLAEGDREPYVALYSDAETMSRIAPAQTPEAAARGFRAALAAMRASPPRRRFWVMREASGITIGLLGLDHDEPEGGEVGALIPPPNQARGYATEAIAALADHAFGTLGLQRLHTRHAAGHGLAAGLMRGLGFRPVPDADGPHRVRWELDPEHWAGRPGRQGGGDPLT
jgi:ribosomal-protein-alanine N-acetyltransferase